MSQLEATPTPQPVSQGPAVPPSHAVAPQTGNRYTWIEKAAVGVLALAFTAWSGVFIYRTSFISIDGRRYFSLFDDAMISMRYAWNLVHGLGLVWNPGQRVEGYSNVLMTLLMAIPNLVFDKIDAVLSIQVLGVALMLTLGFLTMRIAGCVMRDPSPDRRTLVGILAFACAIAYYPLAYWSLMGMETGLLTVLLLSSILLAFQYAESRQTIRLVLLGVCLGLAWLTRNDSLIFAALIWAYVVWETPDLRFDRKALAALAIGLGVYALFLIGQSAFRHLYYGNWLPNTYTLKLTGLPIQTRLRHGLTFVIPFLREIAVALALAVPAGLLHLRPRNVLLLSLLPAAVAYQVYAGGEQWTMWRIMAPSMPLIFLLVILAAEGLVQIIFQVRFPAPAPAQTTAWTTIARSILVTGIVLFVLWTADRRFVSEWSFQTLAFQVSQNERYVDTAVALSQVTTPQATVGVIWAGAIPYYTGRYAIDFLGKSDPYIARLPSDGRSWPGHDKYDLRYSIKILQPTFVQRFNYADEDYSRWGSTRYATAQYEGVQLFLLKDSPDVLWDRLSIAQR